MDEMNNLQNEQATPTPESVETNAPASKIPVPKAPNPMLPIIVSGAIIVVAVVAVALILGVGHKHNYRAWTIVDEPTCFAAGIAERICECGYKEMRRVDALGHTYDDKYDEECNICGYKRGAACPHTETETVPGKAATCTATGLADGSKCKKCGEIVSQPVIPVKPHSEVIDPVKEATCTTSGLTEGKHCSMCNTVIIKQNVIPAAHKYSDKYEYNDDYHWLMCSDCGEKEQSAHTTNAEGVCSVCNNMVSSTPGVIYEISVDGTYAGVIDYNGNAKKVRIAETYQGVPVKIIYGKAFCDKRITDVIIPDSITSIYTLAFDSCDSLTSVVIPNSVTSIGEYAFNSCDSLTSVVIGNSVRSIGDNAFQGCGNLVSVVIGRSVRYIGSGAFRNCSRLRNVFYTGSASEWGSISIKLSNEPLINATRHYNYVPEN